MNSSYKKKISTRDGHFIKRLPQQNHQVITINKTGKFNINYY